MGFWISLIGVSSFIQLPYFCACLVYMHVSFSLSYLYTRLQNHTVKAIYDICFEYKLACDYMIIYGTSSLTTYSFLCSCSCAGLGLRILVVEVWQECILSKIIRKCICSIACIGSAGLLPNIGSERPAPLFELAAVYDNVIVLILWNSPLAELYWFYTVCIG